MITILVANHHPFLRHYVRMLFAGSDIRVIEAANSAEALDQLRTARPDVALVDANLGRDNDLDVLTAAKQDPALRDIPIIVATSGAPGGLESPGRLLQADALLMLPFQFSELLTLVQRLTGACAGLVATLV